MGKMNIRVLFLGAWIALIQVSAGYPHHSNDKNRNATCVLWGESYSEGHRWYRRAETNGGDFCVTCLCTQESKMHCERWSCSNLNCNDDEDMDECCSICDGEKFESATSVVGDADSGESPDWTPSSEALTCSHQDRTYSDGESFASNRTGLQTQQSDQCVQCVCQSGLVLCRLKSCPSLTKCPNPLYTNDDCCPTCPGANTYIPESEFLIEEPDTTDCLLSGVLHHNGEQWHPVVGHFGQMDCVVCHCRKGAVLCDRLRCTDTPQCSNPIKIPGQCCPICPSSEDEEDQQGGKKMGNSKCSLNETKVYRSQNRLNNGNYQYAFQTQNGEAKLVSFTVKDVGRSSDFFEKQISGNEFANYIETSKFKLIGATKSKLVFRFLKRTKKMTEKCETRCERRVERLENLLKLKTANIKCNEKNNN